MRIDIYVDYSFFIEIFIFISVEYKVFGLILRIKNGIILTKVRSFELFSIHILYKWALSDGFS